MTFLVACANKASPLEAVLEGPADRAPPARLIQPLHGTLHWMVAHGLFQPSLVDEALIGRGDSVERLVFSS